MQRSFSYQDFVLLSLCYLLLSLTASAGGHIFRNYSTADGLPDSRVSPIIQDHNGYMWFGTQSGLTRYDGQQFVNFSSAKDIPGIFGRDIIEDHAGGIWFAYTGFARGGVLRVSNGRVQDFSSALPFNEAVSLAEDGLGRIWVGSNDGLTRITFLDSSRTKWTAEQLAGHNAQALYVSRDGKVWIGTADGALVVFQEEVFTTIASGLIPTVREGAMYQDRAGRMWFGGIFGVLEIEGETLRRYTTANGLPSRGVWCFCEDNDGNFWVGTTNGLYRKRKHGQSIRFEKENSFGDAVVYDLCLDAEGNVWFASDPGIRKLLAPDIIVDFPHSDKLATAGFGPITQLPDGSMLFGSRNSGVFRLDQKQLQGGPGIKPSTTLTILSIYPESHGSTWFGIKSGGVILQKGSTQFDFPKTNGFDYRSVHTFYKDREGRMLIGTSQGLWRPFNDSLLQSLHDSVLDSLTIFDLIQSGDDDHMWIATDRGVRTVEVEGDRILSVTSPRNLAVQEKIVYSLLRDHANKIWIGTDGSGLVSFDGTSYHRYTTDDGLASNRVFALAEDSLHSIWIGTSAGLSQFDGTSFRSFTYDEGFREIGLHGLFVDNKGMLWVSNFPGITKIKPGVIPHSTRPPPVYITHMEIDTTNLVERKSIELAPNPAVITFRYAGLSFTDERSVRYRYRLHGFDKDWSLPVPTREVRYTHLGSGSYLFEVLARSADGVWSTKPASISFSILPPLYARWWFVVIFLSVLLAGVYALYRYRLARALELERTRSRIATDLHDDIGSSLTRISVLSEVAQRLPDSEITLSRIGETARELIDTLGDIVWSVDPKHDDLQNVVRRIVQFGQDVCGGKEITFETDIRSTFDQTKLSLDQRRDIYLLFKEALNNVVRHSKASNVLFSVGEHHGNARLSLIDNGVGIDNPHGVGHGLSSMKERAQRAGGALTIGSHDGKGTAATLTLKTG